MRKQTFIKTYGKNIVILFNYRVVDGKRVGRTYDICNILRRKDGRLCSNRVSPAERFHQGRNDPYLAPKYTNTIKDSEFAWLLDHNKFTF